MNENPFEKSAKVIVESKNGQKRIFSMFPQSLLISFRLSISELSLKESQCELS